MRVLVTGSTGLIGSALCSSLRVRGDEVVRLVRGTPESSDEVHWNPSAGELDQHSVEGFDAVVHLAGAGIGDKRWSDARRALILGSRVDSTQLLSARLANAAEKPGVFISSSAIGYYGSRPEPVDEAAGPADPPDFLSTVVVAWEESTRAAVDAGIRTAHLRTGIVLAAEGGALGKLVFPFRAGVGGKLGDGSAWWSWIALEDTIRAIEYLIDTPLEGPVNLTAPNPVTNAELTKTLGAVLRRPTFFTVPRSVLNLMLGEELAESLLFTSSRVVPKKLQQAGFVFRYAELEPALRTILDRDGKSA